MCAVHFRQTFQGLPPPPTPGTGECKTRINMNQVVLLRLLNTGVSFRSRMRI